VTADDDRLAACLADALALRESGQEPDLQALCGDAVHLVPMLAEALGQSAQLPALHRGSTASQPPPPASLAGRYRLHEPIGRGASGTVFRAHDERLQRDVAIKLLHQGLFAGADAEARFQREALALAAHEHPHIVRVYDQGRTGDGTTFLVTELLRGRSLHAVLEAAQRALKDGPGAAAFARIDWLQALLPKARLEGSWLRQLVAWIADLGEGLAAAHAQGICHRDVKPGNAFVTDDGRVVLLDFGIAGKHGDAMITHAHSVLGTPSYMAPEQAAGAHGADPALDVYGLGASLYHLLTFTPPHAGDLQQVLVALRHDDPVPAVRRHKGLARDLQAILDHCLAREPRHRYPTMQALVRDLRAFLAHLPVSVRPLGPIARTWRQCVRRPARSLAVVASVAAAVAVLAAVPAWAGLSERERRDELARRRAGLAADLCIEGRAEERALVPLQEQRAVLAELDAMLELDGADVPLRLLRALAWRDAGDTAKACADLRWLADHAGSPYLRAVADRYATTDGSAIDLAGLPEPTTDADCFVAGFHALRARDCALADTLLTRAAGWLPARDLRLLAILGKQPTEPDRAFAEAKELEGIYGHPTARTRHVLAAAMLQQKKWADSIPFAEDALRLRPDRHGPWNNLGLARLRLGQLDAARNCFERAVALRPHFANSLSGLGQTQRALGRLDEARATFARIADGSWREHELGNLELASTGSTGCPASALRSVPQWVSASASTTSTASARSIPAARRSRARSACRSCSAPPCRRCRPRCRHSCRRACGAASTRTSTSSSRRPG
jgi:tetratricopeptide (TPR) repeat protein